MYSEVAWVLVPSGTQVQPQIMLETVCLPDYLSVSYDYDPTLTVFPLISAGPQISAAPLGILIEISASPLNAALIRIVTIFY